MRSLQTTRPKSRFLRNVTLLIALAATAAVGFQCPSSDRLFAAVCERDITPISPDLVDEYEAAFGGTAVVNHSDPIFIAGFGDNRRATGYNDRLWARGLVMHEVFYPPDWRLPGDPEVPTLG